MNNNKIKLEVDLWIVFKTSFNGVCEKFCNLLHDKIQEILSTLI